MRVVTEIIKLFTSEDYSLFLFFMFKKFQKTDIHSSTQVKSSVQKSITAKIIDQYPQLEPFIDTILPKKTPM